MGTYQIILCTEFIGEQHSSASWFTTSTHAISEVHQVNNTAQQWVIKEVDSNRTYQIIMCTVFIYRYTYSSITATLT